MVCNTCGAKLDVSNSRQLKRTNQVWRRRNCTMCDVVVTTLEGIDYRRSLVVTGSKKPTPYERDRLFLSLYKSLQHRSTSLTDAGALADAITAKLAVQAKSGALQKSQIAQAVQVALTRFDKLAAAHYAALHKGA